MTARTPVEVILLAGSRPGGDPLADRYDVPVKTVVPVAGRPMLAHVMETLIDHDRLTKIKVLAQDFLPFQKLPALNWADMENHIEPLESDATIAASLDSLSAKDTARFPKLITTADNVLLNAAMIDHFLQHSDGFDVTVAVVERNMLLKHYPKSRRTWIKLKGGQFSGANLFYFGSARARKLLTLWAGIEQDRKKGWKVFTTLGPKLLFLAAFRLLTADQLADRVGRKLGLNIKIVQMPQAEACIDVDKPEDLELVEDILARRDSAD